MTITEAMQARHAVRAFTDRRIEGETEAALRQAIEEANRESGLHFQLCLNEPEAFQASKPHYGSFENCRNYIAVVARPGSDEACGYYGEKLVLSAQTLGLNSCWVVLTYKKGKAAYDCADGEKLRCVIALGYGKTQGVPHTSKDLAKVCEVSGTMPDWFKAGMAAALLAPTAVNQQKFFFALDADVVSAKTQPSVIGNTKLDLGIVKYHFELGAGRDNFRWAE
ncbi:MAG: nitroreductase family protein [Oscillospiraceae bacterium]|nr:nitroreductase family protein [Oscillospiraceae bacterium]